MRKGILYLASRNLSVVDDVDDVVSDPTGVAEADDVDASPEVIDLGDGYIEINGYVFHENWDEIDPPGSEDEPEIPHEVVMEKMWAMLRKPV